jgi:hypothetical protein
MTLRARVVLLALAASCAAPPADAAAAPKVPGMPQMETFDVTIRGSQVSTWSLREVDDKDNPCDSPSIGDGSQMLRFFSKKTRVQVLREGASAIVAQTISAPLTVEREGELKSAGAPFDSNACPVVAEGDDFLAPLDVKDCGRRRGKIDLRLQFGEATAADDFLVPLVAKNVLSVFGDFDRSITYDNCPWWPSGGEGPSDTAISPAGRKFTIKNLFNRRRRVLKASADYTRHYTAASFTGKTLLTWNVTMKRVRSRR